MGADAFYRLAIRQGIPSDYVDEFLHEMAARNFGVRSLRDLNPEQSAAMTELIFAHSSPAQRPARPSPRPTTRPRSGRPVREGVIQMATAGHRELMFKIANETEWTRERLNKWLAHHFKVEIRKGPDGKELNSLDQVLTASLCGQVIHYLKVEKRRLGIDRRFPAKPQPHKEVPVAQPTLF